MYLSVVFVAATMSLSGKSQQLFSNTPACCTALLQLAAL
jgi:hypothetical protein